MVKHGETINLKYLKTKISCDAPVLTPDRETGTLPANLLQILNVGTKGAGMELEWSWNGAGSSTAQQDSSTNSGLWSLKAFNEDILKESKEMSKIVQDCPNISRVL